MLDAGYGVYSYVIFVYREALSRFAFPVGESYNRRWRK